MKRCVVCGRETYHKVGKQTVCAQCDVDGSFEYMQRQQAAQPALALDEGYSADLPGDSTPEDLSGLGAGSTPAFRQ